MDYTNYSQYSNPPNHLQATAYDPSQPSQTYDLSTTTAAQSSSYYYYDPQQYASYNPPQDYASYYYPQQQQQQLQETNQQQQPEHIQQYGQAQHELYYPQPGQNPGFDFSQNVGGIVQPTISHPLTTQQTGPFPSRGRGRGRGRGRRGGRISRGGGRGSFGSAMASTEPGSSLAQGSAIPPSKPPRMAWCELCRVECNTPEILEQHRQGKRHMKNLKIHEELQNLKQTSVVEALPVEANTSQVAETESVTKVEEEKPTNERVLGKRKMKSGRGGKFVKTRPVELKQAISFICELCNVKCESQVVLDSHVAGKKHLSNLKKCQSHGAAAYGEEAGLKVVYPPPSSTSFPPPPAVNNQPGAVELGSLLAAHGVSSDESQVLLAQLIMNYVVSQAQGRPVPGVPNPEIYLQSGQQVHGSEPFVGVGADNAFGTTVMNPPGSVSGPEQVASIHTETVIETEMKSGSS